MSCASRCGTVRCESTRLLTIVHSVDNFVPGKLDELRIGFEDMKSVKPDIIHASISGAVLLTLCTPNLLTKTQGMVRQAPTPNGLAMMLLRPQRPACFTLRESPKVDP